MYGGANAFPLSRTNMEHARSLARSVASSFIFPRLGSAPIDGSDRQADGRTTLARSDEPDGLLDLSLLFMIISPPYLVSVCVAPDAEQRGGRERDEKSPHEGSQWDRERI